MAGSVNHGKLYFFTDFLGAALPDEVAGVAENSGTAAVTVGQDGGVAGIVTGATSGNRAHLSMGLNFKASNGSMRMEARVKPLTDITNRANFIGFTDTVAQENPMEYATTTITSDASDAVGFVIDTAGTTAKWHGLAVKADADVLTLANGAINIDGAQQVFTAGTYETFAVAVNVDGDAVLSYGKDTGNKYGLREVLRIDSAITPTVLMTPHVGIETRTTAAKTAYVDYLEVTGARAVA
jgi:hypothetical protein